MESIINNLKSCGALTNNMVSFNLCCFFRIRPQLITPRLFALCSSFCKVWMDIESTSSWSSSCSDNQSWLSQAISQVESMYNGCGLSTCVGIYSSSSQWSPIMCDTTEFSNHQLWYAVSQDPARSFCSELIWVPLNVLLLRCGSTTVCRTCFFHFNYCLTQRNELLLDSVAYTDNNPSFSGKIEKILIHVCNGCRLIGSADFQPFGGWSKPAMKQYAGTTNICGTSIDKDYY